ncbi:retrovirus-related Pol polyprotein from transposon opus [Trichonephila clavipes]|uniref:Retrovirus-related Pol polyprotein from transposon opus n=1 Tax=Trichonephila clavipes TaxID=2585209 RepID=A0A8X6RY33_TRICX|nr:retrovirus-related Pol polyprotein from transposon opus [Trichonephila clavipes]
MSPLDLRSGYFQLAINLKDIKTAFVTKNGTFAFTCMPFGLSVTLPNFQKAIEIILKPVLGRYVSVNVNNISISPQSFTHHLKHIREGFTLLKEAGLTLNQDKYPFTCKKLKYLGWVISKEGIRYEEAKVKAIDDMKPPKKLEK